MIEQTSSIAHEETQLPVIPKAVPPVPERSAAREVQLDACLDHLCASHIGTVSNAVRQEVRADLRAQLDELIAAYQELGCGWEEATSAAVRQLRTSLALSERAQQKVGTRSSNRTHSTRRATLLALGLFASFYAADATNLAWRIWTHMLSVSDVTSADVTDFYRFELFAVPLLVGLVAGLLMRRQAGRGVLNALALLAIPALVLPGLFIGLDYAGLLPSALHTGDSWGHVIPNPIPGLAGVGFWAPLSYAGAQIGNWLRDRGERLPWRRSGGRK